MNDILSLPANHHKPALPGSASPPGETQGTSFRDVFEKAHQKSGTKDERHEDQPDEDSAAASVLAAMTAASLPPAAVLQMTKVAVPEMGTDLTAGLQVEAGQLAGQPSEGQAAGELSISEIPAATPGVVSVAEGEASAPEGSAAFLESLAALTQPPGVGGANTAGGDEIGQPPIDPTQPISGVGKPPTSGRPGEGKVLPVSPDPLQPGPGGEPPKISRLPWPVGWQFQTPDSAAGGSDQAVRAGQISSNNQAVAKSLAGGGSSIEPARMAEAHVPQILTQVQQGVEALRAGSEPALNLGSAEAHGLSEIEKVVQGQFVRLGSGQATMHLQLYPENLGKIELHLIHSNDGVHVSLQADLAATHELLERHLPDLRQSLQQVGVSLGGLTIDYGDQHSFKWEHEQPAANAYPHNDSGSPSPEVEPVNNLSQTRTWSGSNFDYHI